MTAMTDVRQTSFFLFFLNFFCFVFAMHVRQKVCIVVFSHKILRCEHTLFYKVMIICSETDKVEQPPNFAPWPI